MTIPFPPASLVAAYLRDSGGDTQDLSTSQQLAAFQQFCRDNGLAMGEIFQDIARPGSSVIGRDGFHAMMDHFRHGAAEAGIVIWSFSRLARSFDDAAFYRADLRRRGYIIHSLTDDIPEGSVGKLIEAIIDWKNEKFNEDLSRDIKRGLADLVQRYGAIPGRPPLGFKRVPVVIGSRRDGSEHIGHKWEQDPEYTDRIRNAFELRAAGVPLQEIQRQVHLYKSLNCYATFFANRLYTGILDYGGQTYPDYCPPIVDLITWRAAQAKQRQYHPRRVNSRYLLSGLAYCARCGAPLSGLTRSGHQSYACTRQHPHHQCDLQPIPAKVIENAVINHLVEYVLNPDILATQRDEYLQNYAVKQSELREKRKIAHNRCKELQRSIDRVTDAIAQAGASPALLDKLRRLELDLASAQSDLLIIDRKEINQPATLDELLASANQLKTMLIGDHDTAQTAMRGLVYRIVADREGVTVTGLVTTFFTRP